MTTDIWDYPETEAVFPPTSAHERIMWLSLESLTHFWADYSVVSGCLPQVRDAARAALEPFQLGQTNEPAEIRFGDSLLTLLEPVKAQAVLDFTTGLSQLQSPEMVGPWRAFFGQYQRKLNVAGLRPEVAELLANQFREDVVKTKKDREEALKLAVTDITLSEWDLAIHAFYGLNYYSTDQFDKSVVLVGLSALTDAVLFNEFLKNHVVTLTTAEQDMLLEAVRNSWIEIAEADPIAAMKGLTVDGQAEAARIPPAAHLVIAL
jgi:hypothetical protein